MTVSLAFPPATSITMRINTSVLIKLATLDEWSAAATFDHFSPLSNEATSPLPVFKLGSANVHAAVYDNRAIT